MPTYSSSLSNDENMNIIVITKDCLGLILKNLQESNGVLFFSLKILSGLILLQFMANHLFNHNIAIENDFVRYYCL